MYTWLLHSYYYYAATTTSKTLICSFFRDTTCYTHHEQLLVLLPRYYDYHCSYHDRSLRSSLRRLCWLYTHTKRSWSCNACCNWPTFFASSDGSAVSVSVALHILAAYSFGDPQGLLSMLAFLTSTEGRIVSDSVSQCGVNLHFLSVSLTWQARCSMV